MLNIASSRYLLLLILLNVFYFGTTKAQMGKFYFKNFSEQSNFNSKLALYGDAKVKKSVNGSSGEFLQICGSSAYSSGRVMYKEKLKLVGEKPRKLGKSFSMYFVFSLSNNSNNKGGGLAFVMVRDGYNLEKFDNGSFGLLEKGGNNNNKFLAIEFDTFKDKEVGDMNDNHVGIDIGSFISVTSRNASLKLKSGEKLQSWIDYDANSQRLEVRLSKLGKDKPFKPLISFPINLSHLWKEDEVLVGLSASSGNNSTNSTQICNVYSWSFELTTPPRWLHSEALNPNPINLTEMIITKKKNDCALKVLGAFIFGTACGALGAFMVLLIWTILGSRRLPVVPVDYTLNAKEVDCEMTKIVDEMKK